MGFPYSFPFSFADLLHLFKRRFLVSSEVSISNIALGRIGVNGFIDSLTDANAEAAACRQFYEHSRDLALGAAWWNFAKRTATLAIVADEESEEWGYCYALPTDCIKARYIWTGSRTPSSGARIPYELGLNEAGTNRLLLTDRADAVLVYTARVKNPTLFSAEFIDALAWVLARQLAMVLTVRPDLRQQAIAMADRTLQIAAASALNESEENEPDSEFVSGR